MRPLLALALVALLAGCGPVECKARSGSYIAKLTARSGNCGASLETIVSAGGDSASAGCTGAPIASDDNCTVTLNTTCTTSTGKTTTRGGVNWNPDGSEGRGILEVVITSNNGSCQGTYDAAYSRMR